MNKVIYRELVKEDYKEVKNLICEAFGFSNFIKDKNILDIVTHFYLQECVSDSSFSKIAEMDNKVIGIILGKEKSDERTLHELNNKSLVSEKVLETIMVDEENRMMIKEFSKIQDTYKEIIKGKERDFDGCIQLFIVAKEARGLGIGKELLKYLFEYMKSLKVNSLYLYTDTRCNYGFYDSQNFERLVEKELRFDSINEKINVFLYRYNFN
ncbi:GNAT family N-acetyltransferase [Clostridioides difficile]